MTSSPKNVSVAVPPGGRHHDAAEHPPVRVPAAIPDTAASTDLGGSIRGTLERAGGAAPPAVLPALPAPGNHPAPGAEGGSPPARSLGTVPPYGAQGTPPRDAERDGGAGPGTSLPGPAQTTPPPFQGRGGAREERPGITTPGAGPPPVPQEPAGGTRPGLRSITSPPAVPVPRGDARRWRGEPWLDSPPAPGASAATGRRQATPPRLTRQRRSTRPSAILRRPR